MIVIGEFGFLLDLSSGDRESSENFKNVRSLLHRDDSELILLINPHKECLSIVMEDSSVLWPLSLETARLEVLVTTLEKEMIGNELLLLTICHGLKRVIFTLKLTSELIKSGNDELLDLSSLGWSDAGSERIGSKVSCNSDSSRVDHLVLIWWECWAFKMGMIHIRDVLVSWLVTVISLNDLVHEWSEGIVGVMRASIDTDTRFSPLATGHDRLSESETEFISSILAFFPNVWGETFGEEGLAASWEIWHAYDILWSAQVRTNHGSIASWSFGEWTPGLSNVRGE